MRHLTFTVCSIFLRVYDLGPLWSHSCFCYEDFNGELHQLFHGTQNVEEQILLAVSIQQKIPQLIPLLKEGTLSKKLYESMNHKGKGSNFKKECIGDNCFSIGKVNCTVFSAQTKAVVETVVGPASKVYQFLRLQVGDQLIHCKEYRSMTKRNNYTVEYKIEPTGSRCYGHVHFFIKCYIKCPNPQFCSPACKCIEPTHLAVVNKLERNADLVIANDQHTGALVNHIVPVKMNHLVEAIRIADIVRLCVYIDCGSGGETAFVGLFPNQFEKDWPDQQG